MSKRPETGIMQFEDDWPGVFIRGDNAMMFAHYLEQYLQDPTSLSFVDKIQLQGLARLLAEANVNAQVKSPVFVQKAKLE